MNISVCVGVGIIGPLLLSLDPIIFRFPRAVQRAGDKAAIRVEPDFSVITSG